MTGQFVWVASCDEGDGDGLEIVALCTTPERAKDACEREVPGKPVEWRLHWDAVDEQDSYQGRVGASPLWTFAVDRWPVDV